MLRTKKILSVVLAIMMLMQTFVVTSSAADIDGFTDFPVNSWSTEAMTAAVDNGLLVGTSETTIEPAKNLTRAEFAAIVTRAFGATQKADISSFKDVTADDWFYDSVSKVVQMGVMNGTGDTTFAPNAFMKREDVILSLARVLFVDGTDISVLDQFSDRGDIDTWSIAAIAGMVAEDYVHGYEDGTIRPQNYITREELAQLFHNIFKTYISEDGEYNSVARKGSVIVRSKYVTLKDVTIDGDLIMADGIGDGDFRISNVHVTGKIIARGGEGMNYFVDVTSEGKVIVNDPNGTVNFYNYRDEDTPFKNDNVIENTPATFLERVKEDDKPTSSGGGGGVSYTLSFYDSVDAEKPMAEPIGAVKQKSNYVVKEEDVPTDESMQKDDYKFIGWTNGVETKGRDYFVGSVIRNVSGKWYPIYKVEYTITFVTGADEKVLDKLEDEKIASAEIPEITVDESKEFKGWTKTEGSTNVDFTNDQLTADVVENVFDSTDVKLYPVIVDKDATTVVFKHTDGDVTITKYNNPDYVLTDADVPADPEKADNTFKGWSKDPDATEGEDRDYFIGKKISEVEGTWYPVFEEIKDEYTITFVTPDGEVPVTKTEGETISSAEIPEITVDESKEFKGWTKTEGSTNVDFTNDQLTADVVENVFDSTDVKLYPVIVDKDATTVVFKHTDGDVTITKYNNPDYVLTDADVPADPEKADNTFKGWSKDPDATEGEDRDYFIGKKISEVEGTWYPVFEEIKDEYTITFVTPDGEVPVTKTEGETISSAEIPEITVDESKEFKGWTKTEDSTRVDYTNDQLTADVVENVFDSTDVKLYPVIVDKDATTVVFKHTDGDVTITKYNDPDYVLTDADVPADPEKADNTFKGWSKDPDATEGEDRDYFIGKKISEVEGTWYPVFEEIKDEYTITFVTDAGNVVVEKTEGETIAANEIPEITVEATQEFKGWTKTAGSTNVDFTNDALTADVVENVFDSMEVTLYPVIVDKDAVEYFVEHYFEDLDGNYNLDEKYSTSGFEIPGKTVAATAVAVDHYTENTELSEVESTVPDAPAVLTLKLYYDLEVLTVEYYDLAYDTAPVLTYEVKYGGTIDNFYDPADEDKTNDEIKAEIEDYIDYLTVVGYGKDYDDEYLYNEFGNERDGDYAYNITGTYGTYDHEHEINYNWYVEDDVEEYKLFDESHVFTEDLDLYSKIKKLNAVISFPENITTEKLTINIPYEESTRFLDSVRDALYINEGNLMRELELTGLEDTFYDRLSNVGGRFFENGGVFNDEQEINNTDVMIYFYQMMGGKASYRQWLWEEVEDAVEEALGPRGTGTWRSNYESLRTSGLNQEQALYEFFVNKPFGEPPASAQAKYWDSAEFIEMSTEEEFFYATVDNEFIMEKVYDKIDGLKSIDAVIDEYVGGRIPEGLLNRLPMEMVEDIYEPRVAKFLEDLNIAREAAKNGEPKENYPIDSGIIFDINLVEEVLIPMMEFAEETHEDAVDKAVSSNNKVAELVEKYYVDNPYVTGDAGNYGVVNYAFNPDFYVEDTDGDGLYSIRKFENIYNDVVMPESVETIDALLWYMDPEGGAVDFAKIRKLAEENEDLILALHNHPNKLMAEYAENGLPEDMITYYNDLLSDPEIKAAVEKLDNNISFDMMYFVEDTLNNATLEMYFLKVLDRVGIPVENVLDKYTNSKAYKELTHEDFVKLLDQLEECWETVDVDGVMVENANGTTDYVFDNVLEKVGSSGNVAEAAIKGFEMTITRFFADDIDQSAP